MVEGFYVLGRGSLVAIDGESLRRWDLEFLVFFEVCLINWSLMGVS